MSDGEGPGTAAAAGQEAVDRRAAARWVLYDAPVFVRVEPDDDGWGTEITRVILVTDPGDMRPARDERGHFLVYDHDFELLHGARRDDLIDGLRTADSAASDIHRWPGQGSVISTGDWETGPDPRRFPDYYLTDEQLAAIDDDYEDGEDDDQDGEG
jgi:hypothetical protein